MPYKAYTSIALIFQNQLKLLITFTWIDTYVTVYVHLSHPDNMDTTAVRAIIYFYQFIILDDLLYGYEGISRRHLSDHHEAAGL